MRHRLIGASLLVCITSTHAVIAQVGTPDRRPPPGWHTADAMTMKTGPSDGSISRGAIPNEFLEVTVARGMVHVDGGASDQVNWTVRAMRDSVAGMSYVGTTTWKDRFTLDVEVAAARRSAEGGADVQLRVPRDLKLLHISLHGTGNVVVDNYAGELTITADSGDIAGANLSGPMILESRNGGVDLDLAEDPFQHGPISLLSHNGSITVYFPAQPSATLVLSTNCGNINFDFPYSDGKDGKPVQSILGSTAPSRGDADCTSRPRSLPPLLGVKYLHNWADLKLGDGAVTIRAMALEGDINLKKRLARPDWKWGTGLEGVADGQCLEIPDLGKNPDGSPVLAMAVGRVLDADGRSPLKGAHVQMMGTQFGTFSDANGEYRLEFDPKLLGKCRKPYLVVVAPGHRSETLNLQIGSKVPLGDVVLRKT